MSLVSLLKNIHSLDPAKFADKAIVKDPLHCPVALAYKDAIEQLLGPNSDVSVTVKVTGQEIHVEFTNGETKTEKIGGKLASDIEVFDSTGVWPRTEKISRSGWSGIKCSYSR